MLPRLRQQSIAEPEIPDLSGEASILNNRQSLARNGLTQSRIHQRKIDGR